MAERTDQRISDLARRQHGYVTREQLLDLGVGEGAVQYRLTTGRLIQVYRGVYAVGHEPTSPIDRAVAALIACGTGAVLSHGTAATLWDFDKTWRTPFEVTTPNHSRPRGVRIHRSTFLTRDDVTTQKGVRVTSPARTVLDIAPGLSDKALHRRIDDARHARYLRLEALNDVITRFPRHPGARRIRAIATNPNAPSRSELERTLPKWCRDHDLPVPLMNHRMFGYECDAVFLRERVILEIDGWEFHSSRYQFERDRTKDRVMLAHGFVTVRLAPEHINDAEAERIHAILAKRR